jgi:hypothetical protein
MVEPTSPAAGVGTRRDYALKTSLCWSAHTSAKQWLWRCRPPLTGEVGCSILGVQNRFHRSFMLWCRAADARPACASGEPSCRTTYSASSRTPPSSDEPILYWYRHHSTCAAVKVTRNWIIRAASLPPVGIQCASQPWRERLRLRRQTQDKMPATKPEHQRSSRCGRERRPGLRGQPMHQRRSMDSPFQQRWE